jgi:oligopeptide/dipeptide ABC transporter ATP-binding protein
MAGSVLRVEGLKTQFRLRHGTLTAVDGVSFALDPGKTLCIVGESGSGKSVTAQSILRLIEPPGKIVEGRIFYKDVDLLTLPEREMERLRGDRIGMVFQDPMTSLNPAFTVGDQIAEGLMVHQGLRRGAALDEAVELLRRVGIARPERRVHDYPYQFSGGMRQRALIAAAIACRPEILIADEPTTALDVTIQAQILKLLADLQKQLGIALVLITHDLGVVASIADQVLVMYAGRVAEYGDVTTVFREPRHPYTIGLMRSIIRLDEPRNAPLRSIPGTPLVPINPPPGCAFRFRCESAEARCAKERPELRAMQPGHLTACHFAPAPS